MAIVGVFAHFISIGAINTNASTSFTLNFASSSVWSQTMLQGSGQGDTPGGADSYISKFVEKGTPKTGKFPIVFADNCTSVTYKLDVNECNARAVCVTQFFG